MSVAYKAIQWNPYKRRYDLVLGAMIAGYLAAFVIAGKLLFTGQRAYSDEVLVLRALGTCAFILLNLAIVIGPVARLDRRFIPLLYNRRHLGVATFALAALHGLLAVGYYHGFSDISPPVSLLTSNTQYRSVSAFPFETLGLIALLILFLMAATSHDFWLKNLSPRVWKWLHMMVYVAWGLTVMHVALGAMQSQRSALYPILLGTCALVVPALHILAGVREWQHDRTWTDACAVDDLVEGRGRVVCGRDGERVALFRHNDSVSAISNVCAHQGGPLGEGRIIDGCVTCPWHGYQYRAQDGCAPPPFTEKLPTYPLRIENGRVFVSTESMPPGTYIEPARISREQHATVA